MTTTLTPGQRVSVHSTGRGTILGYGTVRQVTPSGVIVDYTSTKGKATSAMLHPTLVRSA
jgi:hypothetical protein